MALYFPKDGESLFDADKRISVEASAVVGIPLLDHLILGRSAFVSLRESGEVAF